MEPFFDDWVIPLLKQIPDGDGFFYVHGCDGLVEWVQEKSLERAMALAQRIVTLSDECLHRMFRHLDIKAVAAS